jgi:phosphoglycerate dehydrogenase-like enzyme
LLKGQTVGVIGAGRIGSAYARMMVFIHPASVSSEYVAKYKINVGCFPD